MTLKRSTKIPLAHIIIAFSIVIMLLNISIAVNRSITSYEESIAQGREHGNRLIRSFTDHVELTYLAADMALRRAIERQHFNSLFGKNLNEDIQSHLTKWVNETPQISAMLMTDEAGMIHAFYKKQGFKTWLDGKDSVSDRQYFIAHALGMDQDALVIEPQRNWKKDGEDFVVMTRRVNNLDGSFGGIVLVAISNAYLLDFFASVEAGANTKVVLMRNDKTFLINQLGVSEETDLLRRIMGANNVAERASHTITIVNDSPVDDIMRMFTFDHIPNLSLILAVVTYGEDIFRGWSDARIHDIIFLCMFALFVVVISFFTIAMVKQMKRVEESERMAIAASQTKSEFLANMSHELRTPLNAIIGFSEMLDSGYFGKLNAKQKERIHDVHLCGTHLLELIDDILEFSKGDAGRLELKERQISLPQIIQESIQIMHDRSKKEKVKILSNNVAKDLPPIMADEQKIRQTLINLLSNAVKFTNEGGTVEVGCSLDDRRDIMLTVTDTGIGMKEESIPKAMSVFGQVHGNDALYGGTGLGLPLCKMFAELHDGTMKIQSIEGVGTKVTIILPTKRIVSRKGDVHRLNKKDSSAKEEAEKDVEKDPTLKETNTPAKKRANDTWEEYD